MNIIFGSIVRIVAGFYVGCTGMALTEDRSYVKGGDSKQEFVSVELECETRDGLRSPRPNHLIFSVKEIELIEQPKRPGVK